METSGTKKRKRNNGSVGITKSSTKLAQGHTKRLKMSSNYTGRRFTTVNTIGLDELTKKIYDVGSPNMKVVRLLFHNNQLYKHTQSRINRSRTNTIISNVDWRPLTSNFSQNLVYFFEITITNYDGAGGLHANHAIGAVKYGNSLYVFDPHGHARQPVTDWCAAQLAQVYHIPHFNIIVFDGPKNKPFPQASNTQGVCLGITYGFLVYMAGLLSGKYLKPNGRSWKNTHVSRANFNATIYEHFKNISTNSNTCQRVFANLMSSPAVVSYSRMNRN